MLKNVKVDVALKEIAECRYIDPEKSEKFSPSWYFSN